MTETIAIASDHAGFALKGVLKLELESLGYAPLDLGTDDTASVDYPDYAEKLAQAIKAGKASRGILVCGTGIGISIAANRHREIRAALCQDVTTARLSREHNDANVLVLGGRIVGEEVAKGCLKAFLETPFAGGRHEGRVAKLAKP
ncbi:MULTISPECIES: ribose 5-phosphate isomerase B [Oceanibaculum]|uniref:Ribose 5-phosphate isomerase B n=1 Tax=Oceanibaculum indicum P24 TaxID=1207063 RepID=K2J3Z8_9PROT|nr:MULTISPECIES: ribose 5-phosphate isomerase B [Oceanibaculum]EKE77706.1 ribose 5-phosphate isomerase B [Oceanibaculum indicum P24]MCH2395158.1 ribose 5-phosphate isomerase B [Oceanibaculum sp.]